MEVNNITLRSNQFLTSLLGGAWQVVVADLGWVDLNLDVPSSWPPPEPILPNFHMPKQ